MSAVAVLLATLFASTTRAVPIRAIKDIGESLIIPGKYSQQVTKSIGIVKAAVKIGNKEIENSGDTLFQTYNCLKNNMSQKLNNNLGKLRRSRIF